MTTSKVKRGAKLFPTDPVAAAGGALSAWFSLTAAGATVTGAGYSSVPDRLDASNPATQSTDARRPTNQTSSNGLPIMTWPGSGNQVLVASLTSARNGTSWGCGMWVRPSTLAPATQALVSILNTATGASGDKFIAYVATDLYGHNAYASNGDGRRAQAPVASALVSTWQFVTAEFDAAGGSEATRNVVTVDGAVQSLTFTSIGAGTAPTSLPTPTGNLLIGSGTNAASSSFVFSGSMGPNIYLFGAKMAGAGVGLLTQQARLALMNYQRPR